jgi:resuscitation-promoting factor RpfB
VEVLRADTVRVTNRTVFLACVMATVALLLGGCRDSAVEPAPAAPAAPAAAAEPSGSPDQDAGPSPSLQVDAPPTVETRTVTETKAIAYSTRTVKDSALLAGTTRVRTKGVPGVRTLTYEVTLTDGRQTAKKLITSVVTRKPITKVVAVGTRKPRPPAGSGCDPNYSGACVPIASDVDCAGGSGNGPAYVQGPVTVVGTDVYDLDRDGDGIGCDS